MRDLKRIKGDASFRKFFRKKRKDYSSIVVFAKKEKFKNLLVYDAVNKILNKNKVLAPNLIEENYETQISEEGLNVLFVYLELAAKSNIKVDNSLIGDFLINILTNGQKKEEVNMVQI